jgi:hypothetical protein
MNERLLMVLMTALGVGLALNPVAGKINPNLFKASTWLFSGIIFRLLK